MDELDPAPSPVRPEGRGVEGARAHEPLPPWPDAAPLLERGPDALVLLDAQGRYRWGNARAGQALGPTGGTPVGRLLWDAFPALAGTPVESAIRGALVERRAHSVGRVAMPRGAWFGVHAIPVATGVAVTFRGLTAAVAAEEALRASETRYRALLDQLGDGIVVVDAIGDGRLVMVNDRLCEMTGYTCAELLSMRVADLVVGGPDGDLPERLDRLARGETLSMRRQLRRSDGTLRTSEITARRIGTRVQAVVRDVTDRELFEERRRSAQRLEALGLLAGSVAHDFNNFLLAIQSNVELALGEIGASPAAEAVRTELEDIRRVARRAAGLTRQLLTFSRKQARPPATFPLGDAVTGIEQMLRLLLRPAVDLEIRGVDEAGHVRADLGQLEQAVMNLVVNARDAMRDAMREGGVVTVELSSRVLAMPARIGIAGQCIPPGEYAVLAVSDTGTGMTRETATRVFEPLFTTKAAGGGTGLGLWTVQAAVTQAGGYVTVDSTPGEGSTFELWLPAVDASEGEDASGAPGELIGGAAEPW